MKRSGPIKSDPEKQRAWQARGAAKYAEKVRSQPLQRRQSALPTTSPRSTETPVQPGTPKPFPRWLIAVPEQTGSPFRPDPKPAPKGKKKPRNDSGWRAEVMALHGEVCVRCGDTAHVQADHLWPRSQGGPSHPLNGLPLCGEFSRNTPGGCHPLKTASSIVIEPSWLLPEQQEWLASVGWVDWDADGNPFGRGMKHFGVRSRRAPGMKGGS